MNDLLRLTLALLVGLGSLRARPPEPPGRLKWLEFGLEDGLQDLNISTLSQDRDGFVWVGTETGLHRFDGKSFQSFRRPNGLPSSVVQAVLVHPDGKLWIGTFRGLARSEGDRFVAVGAGLPDPAPSITALAVGPGGRLHVGTATGPYRQTTGDHFETMPSWPGGAVAALASLPEGGGLVASSWDGHRARVFRAEGGAWQELAGPAGFGKRPLRALAVDGTGTLWARSTEALWCLRQGRFEPAPFPVKRTNGGVSLHVDGRGRLWMPGNSELVWLDKGDVLRMGVKEGWPGGLGAAVLMDRGGALWAGGRGLGRVKGRRFWRSHGAESGLADPCVWSLIRDRFGTMFAGTQRGLARLGPGGWQMIPGTEDTQVRSVVQGPDGAFYLAGSAWVRRWDPATGQTVKFGPQQGVRADGRIFRLVFDRSGTLWVATDSGGLLRGTGHGSLWGFTPEPLPGGTPRESIGDLHEDAEGRLWAAGEHGLALREGGRWRRFTRQDGLREDALDFTRSLRNGDLLLAYSSNLGVARARYDKGRFRILKHFDAEIDPALTIFLLGEDVHGNLWVGSGAGVHLVHAGGGVEVFTYRDGLVSDGTNNMAFLPDPNGDVWIGTVDGIARFVARAYDGLPPPPVLRTYAFTLGQASFHEVPDKPLDVPFRSNTFEARFAALSIHHQDDLHLGARLEGLEPEWHAAKGREARYTGLAPGLYAFQVRSQAGGGPWVYSTPIRFRVLPPWWGSWTFRVLAGLGVVAGAIAYARWRTWALARRNAHLEERVEERTRELTEAKATLEERVKERTAELQASHSQLVQSQKMESLGFLAGGVAHDMNNVLGAILTLASVNLEVHEADSATHRAFETIVKAAERGTNVVKGLLSFARAGVVENRLLNLNDVVREEIKLLERTTLVKVRFELDLDPALRPMKGDAGSFAQVFMNLCINAMDAMPENGTLVLRTRNLPEQRIEAVVEDNGSGMTREVLDRALDPFFTTKGVGKGTGLGLSMVYSTVKAHHGQLELQSEPGRGTRVRMTFPACAPAASAPVDGAEPRAAAAGPVLDVLLVEDDEFMMSTLQNVLEYLGHTFTAAACGEEALARLGEGYRPDVVILDMNMPGLGGAGTLPRLRALCPGIPVLLATGRTDQDALDLVAAYDQVTLMAKPFGIEELRYNLGSCGKA
ncbi:hybrid sensor histidine kinase/response regulator [Geothrix sp. 21YS21S-2]|uniref:hybrid sensor histidine kinase/response regulator n=1 Tax=Geothrix sp. 21YS21S-2 TaxID=3068893 RepID=UPI0027B96EE5|nr:hybrid sensor histidine kinase/response regulator [Geothrix sp. 21YS21S-2]